MIDQISVFMENTRGAMHKMLACLSAEDINILGFVTNDSAEFGIVRVIVSDTDRALELLKQAGYQVKRSRVLGVEMEDKPGELEALLQTLDTMNINIDYLYLGYNRENSMPMTMIHCESMEVVCDTLRRKGYPVR